MLQAYAIYSFFQDSLIQSAFLDVYFKYNALFAYIKVISRNRLNDRSILKFFLGSHMKHDNYDLKSEIEIRQASIDDLAAIFHLGEKMFTSQEAANLYRTWDEYAVTSLFNSEPEFMLVADIDSQVIGFALGTLIEKNRSAWTYGHLLWLAVEPEYARIGVASELFNSFSKTITNAGARMLMVDTQADNDKAISFFKDKGFIKPIDHVYMTLFLESKSGTKNGKDNSRNKK